MIVTQRVYEILFYRRTVKRWRAEGFEDLGERGGMLWEIYRGRRVGQIIKEARIAPDGMSVFVRIGRPE